MQYIAAILSLVCLWLLPARAVVLQVDTVNARMTLNGQPFVPICTWVQPSGEFAFWKSMGANTMIGDEDMPNWLSGLATNGLYGMPGRTSTNSDRTIAYIITDEPDIQDPSNPSGPIPRTDTTTITNQARSMRTARPGYPLFLNFSGAYLMTHLTGTRGEAIYRSFCRAADLVCQDIYPVSNDQSPENIIYINSATKILIRYVDNKKPVGAFLEVGRVNGGDRNPTPGEIRSEVWTAIGAGCRYICYFPPAFDPWTYNSLRGNTANENMVKWCNGLVTQMAAVIMEPAITFTGLRRTFTGPTVMMNIYYRRLNNDLYIIAVSTRAAATSYKLTFPNAQGTAAEVMGESRSEAYVDTGITDDFTTTNTSHVYRLPNYFQYNTAIADPGGFTGNRSVLCLDGPAQLQIDLGQAALVTMDLFNQAGGKAEQLLSGRMTAGRHAVTLDPGKHPAGVYFVRLAVGNKTEALPVVIVK